MVDFDYYTAIGIDQFVFILTDIFKGVGSGKIKKNVFNARDENKLFLYSFIKVHPHMCFFEKIRRGKFGNYDNGGHLEKLTYSYVFHHS